MPRKFDLGCGSLGNGYTVWNRAKEVSGDYEKIAHVARDRKITWYLKNPPADVTKYVEEVADGPVGRTSTSQLERTVLDEKK